MRGLVAIIERISGASGKLTAWLVAPLILATVYDVAARYLFSAPTQWAYEVGYMVMGTHALIGGKIRALTAQRFNRVVQRGWEHQVEIPPGGE